MSVVNQLPLPADVFFYRDLALSRDGKKLALIRDSGLVSYRIPSFIPLLNLNLNMQTSFSLQNGVQPERLLGAWGSTNNFAATIFSLPFRFNSLANFDQDGKTDLAVFRPSTGEWISQPTNGGGQATVPFGAAGDVPVSADYDGDGVGDPAVFRASTSTWFYLESSTGITRSSQFGIASDQFIPADYDGDGKDDLAVFRAFSHSWIVVRSSDGQIMSRKVASGRGVAVRGDYDGDGVADMAFFSNGGNWQIFTNGPAITAQFGQPGDIPVSGDFDNDGKSDLAVFRPSTNTWLIAQSYAGPRSVAFGQSGDKLVPADYDADGKTDIAVFRPSTAAWSILRSSDGGTVSTVFGQSADIPVAWQR